jgi:protein phosphatase 1B
MRHASHKYDLAPHSHVDSLESGEDVSGSTATTVLVTPTHIIFANCGMMAWQRVVHWLLIARLSPSGDSRSVLFSNSQVKFATDDHKPNNHLEQQRIEVITLLRSIHHTLRSRPQLAGGFVEAGRVCGNLAISRALGDFGFKNVPHLPEHEQKVCVESDITIFERTVSHLMPAYVLTV